MAKLMREAELEPRAGDENLSADELTKIAVFDGVKPANLERYPGAVVLRHYGKGEVVCRQGEAGWTAFYILTTEDLLAIREAQDASVSQIEELRERAASLHDAADQDKRRERATVTLSKALKAAASRADTGVLQRAMHRLFGVDSGVSRVKPTHIPIDGPVDLAYAQPVASLYEGELFGEMSCLNRYPRSATVRITDDCYMIEMLRNVLELLQKNKAFKERMDAVYRTRVLGSHLRSLPIFGDATDDALAELAERVELVYKEPGEVIFREGDPSDSLYVIRIGMVKATHSGPGGERVLAYRGRGEYIGEIGLVQDVTRTSTCTAVDHPVREGDKKRRSGRVELVRVTKDDMESLFGRFPEIRAKVEAVAVARLKPDEEPGRPMAAVSHRFDELGLLQGQKLMLIDLDRCTRCDECVRACAATHADGRTRLIREGPRYGQYLVPSSCRQCLDPVCMIGCPVGSIHKGDTGEILIEDWCIGCEICAKQCPYDAINMHAAVDAAPAAPEVVAVTQEAVVCDQCSSLSGGTPSCVYACPHDAAMRVDARAFFDRPVDSRAVT